MKRWNIYIILFIIFYGCSVPFQTQNVTKDILKEIKKCNNQECIVNVNNITDFSWDRMYVFANTANEMDIEKVIGHKIKNYSYTEFTRKIIFTYKGKIVHYELYNINIERPKNNELMYDYLVDSVNYVQYSPKGAIFKVQKRKFDKGVYYDLHSIK